MDKKKVVIITHYKVVSWLYSRLIPKIRKRFNCKVLLILPERVAIPEIYQKVLVEDDDVIHVPRFADLNEKFKHKSIRSEQDLYVYAKKYDVKIIEDILLQERIFAEQTMTGSARASKDAALGKQNGQLKSTILFYFEFFENLTDKYKILMALVWPRSAWETILGLVVLARGILVTYPYTAKGVGNLAYWADGLFANSIQIQKKLRNEVCDPSDELKTLVAGRPDEIQHENLDKKNSAPRLFKRLLLIWINHFIYKYRSIRLRKKFERRSPLLSMKMDIGSFFYWKKFQSLCVKPSDNVFDEPYGLYVFQNEPEFSVQGRCKEFHDQLSIIKSIANSLPLGTTLLIKEHAWIGHRKISFYQEILRYPNIMMVSPSVPASKLIKKATFLVSLNGTAIFEAATMGIPAAFFSRRSEFQSLENACCFDDLISFGEWVNQVANHKITTDVERSILSARKYVKVVKDNSFDGTPLFYSGAGTVDNVEIEKSFNLLCDLLDVFKQNKSSFTHKIISPEKF
ncbi:hypothetical protein OAN83_01240 [Alphaproteobacteria bacterium]|nr:hypothetical protein [Alphaproteobacteria bacterium]